MLNLSLKIMGSDNYYYNNNNKNILLEAMHATATVSFVQQDDTVLSWVNIQFQKEKKILKVRSYINFV